MNKLMKLLMISCLFVGFSVASIAQTYGGSASVQVVDKNGNRRYLNTTTFCKYDDTSSAKSSLSSTLRQDKEYDEEYDGGISYAIDSCSSEDEKSYGGSASVKLINSDGKIRTLNTTTFCKHDNIPSAKSELLYLLRRDKKYNEEYYTSVYYEIDSCK